MRSNLDVIKKNELRKPLINPKAKTERYSQQWQRIIKLHYDLIYNPVDLHRVDIHYFISLPVKSFSAIRANLVQVYMN